MRSQGVIGGGQLGYNIQFGSWVAGIETEPWTVSSRGLELRSSFSLHFHLQRHSGRAWIGSEQYVDAWATSQPTSS